MPARPRAWARSASSEVKWMKPVYADDELTLRYTVLDKRISRSRPEMGIVTMKWEALDQHGTVKTEMTGVNLFRVRNVTAAEASA
jgi:acyl dehydratase